MARKEKFKKASYGDFQVVVLLLRYGRNYYNTLKTVGL